MELRHPNSNVKVIWGLSMFDIVDVAVEIVTYLEAAYVNTVIKLYIKRVLTINLLIKTDINIYNQILFSACLVVGIANSQLIGIGLCCSKCCDDPQN